MGLNDRVSSVRELRPEMSAGMADNGMQRPGNGPDFSRRRNERLYEANVTSVRAIVGPGEQRCWMEREQVVQERANVPGALAGALLGGIIGHQIGGGTGRDVATAGGVVAGAAIGSQVGRDGQRVSTQPVQRCTTATQSGRPDYWDVSYRFRGQDHRMQMTSAPGPTVTVNRDGEPRG
jgi:uncharacterized protein YcfJ